MQISIRTIYKEFWQVKSPKGISTFMINYLKAVCFLTISISFVLVKGKKHFLLGIWVSVFYLMKWKVFKMLAGSLICCSMTAKKPLSFPCFSTGLYSCGRGLFLSFCKSPKLPFPLHSQVCPFSLLLSWEKL